MKKIQIIALIMVAAAVAILIIASKDVSSYATFDMAKNGQRVKIVGELAKDKPMKYEPDQNPNIFEFTMMDSEGFEMPVVLAKAKPQDFERAESIVLTGSIKNEVFYADEILMKCPSKYKDEELKLKEGASVKS